MKLLLTAKTGKNYDNTPLQLALEQLSVEKYEIVENAEYNPEIGLAPQLEVTSTNRYAVM